MSSAIMLTITARVMICNIFEAPPSPDYVSGSEHPPSPSYVPGPEELKKAPLSPDYVPEPEYPEYLVPSDAKAPIEDQPLSVDASPAALSPSYVADFDSEEDPEEDPAKDPADGGDDDDDESSNDEDNDDECNTPKLGRSGILGPEHEATSTGVDVRHGGAATTVTSLDVGQGSGNIIKTLSMPHDLPLPRFHTLGSDEVRMQHNELMDLVTKLSDRVVALETDLKQTKKVYGRKIEEFYQDPDISLIQHDAEIQGRYDQDMKFNLDFDAAKEVSTAEKEVSTAKTVFTTGAAITTASVDVSLVSPTRRVSTADDITMAETLVYIRRSVAKDKVMRLQEELDEEERQRMARVHEAAQSFIKEEWENIRARVKADEELTQRLQAEERNKYSEVDQAKMLVDLINQRKRYHQLRRYSFDELKTLFETTMMRLNTFVPIESKVDRSVPEFAVGSLKRGIEERDQGSFKRQKTGESSKLAKSPRDKDANELEYPLSRGVLTLMLGAKLLVEQDNEMSRELLMQVQDVKGVMDSTEFPRHSSLYSSPALFTTDRLVNGSSCGGIDMVIKDLDLEPKIDAMMRDFLKLKRYHIVPFGELNGVPVALVARSGVISKCTDRIFISHGGKGVSNLVDKAGPLDIPPNLGVFELTNGSIIGGNCVAEHGAEMMIEIQPSYVPDSIGQHYPLVGSKTKYRNMGQAYGAMSQMQDYTAYLNNMSGLNYGNPLSNEGSAELLVVYQKRVEELTNSLHQTEGIAKGLEANLSRKVSALEREKSALRHDLDWVMKKAIPRMLARVFRGKQFDRELVKVQKVFVKRGRELGRQEALDLLMTNQCLLGYDPNLLHKVNDTVRGLKKLKWECMETIVSSFDLSSNLLRSVLERGDSGAGEGSSSRLAA
nr:hypothetical protein [Tanacetum cinerariifolium]